MSVTDPIDGRTLFDNVRACIRKYTLLMGADALACFVDDLRNRVDVSKPSATIAVVGTGASQKVAHNLKDADGKPAKPRYVHVTRWKGATELDVISVDDTNLEVSVTNKGEATFALYL